MEIENNTYRTTTSITFGKKYYMAILKNFKNDTNLELKLKTIKDSPDWIGYEWWIFLFQSTKKIPFLRFDRSELYFDNLGDYEVKNLCNLINSIVNGDIDKFIFEPVDEKDFRLEIIREYWSDKIFYRLSLFTNMSIILDSFEWNGYSTPGIQIKTSKENLVVFTNELRKEYEDLMNQFKQK